jgi:ribosome-binding protein aMBF1 (putative translation factor)
MGHAIDFLDVEMQEKKQMINRIRMSYNDFLESAKLKNRKSEFITCPECGSKINIPALVKYRGEDMHSCPLCGVSLWSKSTKERNRSFHQRIEKAEREYKELEAEKEQDLLDMCVNDFVHEVIKKDREEF